MQVKKVYIYLVFISLFTTGCAEHLELESLIPDKKGHNLNFVSVSIDRIKEKQKLWEDEFDNQQLKRILTYLGAAVVVGGVSFAFAKPYVYPESENGISSSSLKSNKKVHENISIALNRAQVEHLKKNAEERTFTGMLKKNGKAAASIAIGSAAVSFFSYLFSSSGAYLKKKIKRGFGFGESEVFAGLVKEVLYNGEQLEHSLSSFIHVCEEDKKNNNNSNKLRSCLCCGVGIDHFAFIAALEQWAAFILEFLNHKNITDEKKEEVFRSLVTLLGFFEELVCCEQEMYCMYMSSEYPDDSKDHENFTSSLSNFCLEVCRLSQRVGTLYYGTDFTLKNLRRC